MHRVCSQRMERAVKAGSFQLLGCAVPRAQCWMPRGSAAQSHWCSMHAGSARVLDSSSHEMVSAAGCVAVTTCSIPNPVVIAV